MSVNWSLNSGVNLFENTCWAITGRRPISGTAVITELAEKFKRSFKFPIIAKVSGEQLILKQLGSSHLCMFEVTPLKFQRNVCMNNSRTRCQHFLKHYFIFRCRKLSSSLKFVIMWLGNISVRQYFFFLNLVVSCLIHLRGIL